MLPGNEKYSGLGGDPDIGRLTAAMDAGLRFHTTQTDIAYLMEGGQQAGERASRKRRRRLVVIPATGRGPGMPAPN